MTSQCIYAKLPNLQDKYFQNIFILFLHKLKYFYTASAEGCQLKRHKFRTCYVILFDLQISVKTFSFCICI